MKLYTCHAAAKRCALPAGIVCLVNRAHFVLNLPLETTEKYKNYCLTGLTKMTHGQ